jgi:hypothetical protein
MIFSKKKEEKIFDKEKLKNDLIEEVSKKYPNFVVFDGVEIGDLMIIYNARCHMIDRRFEFSQNRALNNLKEEVMQKVIVIFLTESKINFLTQEERDLISSFSTKIIFSDNLDKIIYLLSEGQF